MTNAYAPPGLPIVGHARRFLQDKLGFLTSVADTSAPVVRLQIGRRTYLLLEPADLRHVLVTNSAAYSKTPRLTSSRGRRLSGNGVLTAVGAAHAERRRLLQPAFHRRAVGHLAAAIVGTADDAVDRWLEATEIDVASELSGVARAVVLRTVFGPQEPQDRARLDALVVRRRQYLHDVFASLVPMIERLPTRTMRGHRQAGRELDAAIRQEIRARQTGPSRPRGLLDDLVALISAEGTHLSEDELRDEVLTLCVTGHETIGDTLAWTWLLLADHPVVAARVAAEVDATLGGRAPGMSDVARLPYTAQVVAESIRLFPATWIFVRMAAHDDELPSGVTIPRGAKLYVCPWVLHRDERWFPDPERFDPSNFDPARSSGRPRFAYLPFGAGPRRCLGEDLAQIELLLVIARLAQRVRFTVTPGQAVTPLPRVTLQPSPGILARVEAR